MIRNLNPLTFQGFGTILPEKGQANKYIDKNSLIALYPGEKPVYRAVCDTWLNCGTGMSVLSVSLDGENYQEIGARLGKTAKSIDNALQRIRRKAEKIL